MENEINKIYLKKETLKALNNAFYSNDRLPSITLQDFFDKNFYQQIQKNVSELKYKKTIMPMAYSYSKSNLPKGISQLINSNKFLGIISVILDKKIQKIKANAFCFSWKNYITINDRLIEKPGIDLIINFTNNWDEGFGGSIIYADGTGEYFKIPPSGNSITIVKRKKNMQRFVQYVNHLSDTKKRYFILGKLD